MTDTRKPGLYGRKPPKNAPALKLSAILTGVAPTHPVAADYLTSITDWQMNGNDQYGDCVAVAMGNIRKVITTYLGDATYNPSEQDCLNFYKTQNPHFPNDDNGMDEQTALEEMHANGDRYYDGVKPLAFAKVDVSNLAELDAAVAIFGPTLLGIEVSSANEDEFSAEQAWDYNSRSQIVGGHAVVEGGYNEGQKTGEFETWAAVTHYTDAFRQHQLEEAWVVIWPEHLGTKAFQEGVDQAALASAYTALTGQPFPVSPTPPQPPEPPVPPVGDPDSTLVEAQLAWEAQLAPHARRKNLTLAAANQAWRAAKGL